MIVLWHVGSTLWNLSQGAGPLVLVWDLVLLPPILGALAIFRRTFALAVFSMGVLLVVTLVEPNPMEQAWKSLLMAVAMVSFVELSWSIERFDSLFELGGPAMERGRGLRLFRDTVSRYLMVFVVVLGISAMMTMAITYAPSLYYGDPAPGTPSPVEADSMFAVAFLLFWLVVAAVVGRWAVLQFMDSRTGENIVGWLRERIVMPGSRRPGNGDRGPPPADDVEWDEEAPIPDVPTPQA
jgi:hypothetical protein